MICVVLSAGINEGTNCVGREEVVISSEDVGKVQYAPILGKREIGKVKMRVLQMIEHIGIGYLRSRHVRLPLTAQSENEHTLLTYSQLSKALGAKLPICVLSCKLCA